MSVLLKKAINPKSLRPQCFQNFGRSNCSEKKPEIKHIPIKDLRCFVKAIFEKMKVTGPDADTMADAIVDADMRGYYPHGVFRLPKYLCSLDKGEINVQAKPSVVEETNCSAAVDGCNGLGPVVAKFCMNLAIEKAKKFGGSIVSAKQSNYFGAASHYTQMATKNCFIGIALSNTPPMMLPFGAKCALLGSNPLAFAAVGELEDIFSFDMATSKISKESVEWKGETCQKLPPGTALNMDFKETLLPREALRANKFLPFGDLRGYGFSLAIEILTGIMSGANYGKKFLDRKENEPWNIGHTFIVLDPKKFFCNFPKFLNDFMYNLRSTPPRDEKVPIRAPGDLGAYLTCRAESEGLPYNTVQIAVLKSLATMYKIEDLNKFLG